MNDLLSIFNNTYYIQRFLSIEECISKDSITFVLDTGTSGVYGGYAINGSYLKKFDKTYKLQKIC